LAARVETAVKEEIRRDEEDWEHHPARKLLDQEDVHMTALNLQTARNQLRSLRQDVANSLSRDPFSTAGLLAYVAGAVVGLVAGLLAVAR